MKPIKLINDQIRHKIMELIRNVLRNSLAPDIRRRKEQTYKDAIRIAKEALKAEDPNAIALIKKAMKRHADVTAEGQQYVSRGVINSLDTCTLFDNLTVDTLYSNQPMYIKNLWHSYLELDEAIRRSAVSL